MIGVGLNVMLEMNMLKLRQSKLVFLLLSGLLSLLFIIIIKTLPIPTAKSDHSADKINFAARYPDAIKHLASAVQIKTISEPTFYQEKNFLKFDRFLINTYATTAQKLIRIKIAPHTFLYQWPGKSLNLPAIVIMSHYDTVPASDAKNWDIAPFSGVIKNNFLWGRGAIDDKSGLIATFEAVNYLIKTGFQPRQSIYFAVGADEEIGGKKSSALIAKYLMNKHEKIAWILDEGMPITQGQISVVTKPVALIGVAEKGYLSLRLTSYALGGHTALPATNSAILKLSRVLLDLDKNPLPPHWNSTTESMFNALQPFMKLHYRFIFSNLWLMKPILIHFLLKSPPTRALISTAFAPTIMKSGTKDNVLPNTAELIINFRLILDDHIADVVSYVQKYANQYDVKVSLYGDFNHDPIPPANMQSAGYKIISATVSTVFPEAIVAPAILLGTTDSRYYSSLTQNIFRFNPTLVENEDIKSIHGNNEKIALQKFLQMIYFYEQLIIQATA